MTIHLTTTGLDFVSGGLVGDHRVVVHDSFLEYIDVPLLGVWVGERVVDDHSVAGHT